MVFTENIESVKHTERRKILRKHLNFDMFKLVTILFREMKDKNFIYSTNYCYKDIPKILCTLSVLLAYLFPVWNFFLF